MERIDGREALYTAKRKARFGHKDWLLWTDANGDHAAPRTADNIKAMLLAVGIKGRWFLVEANSGNLCKGFWWLGINILRQSRHGWA